MSNAKRQQDHTSEAARLQADFDARSASKRPLPRCVAKAYKRLIEQQRGKSHLSH